MRLLAKIENSESWNLEDLEHKMKKVFFREKNFHLLRRLLYKNGMAQSSPVVAGGGRLCYFHFSFRLDQK